MHFINFLLNEDYLKLNTEEQVKQFIYKQLENIKSKLYI
jgi:hypothetical protein